MSVPDLLLRSIKAMGRSDFRFLQAIARRIGADTPRDVTFTTDFDGMSYAGSLRQSIDRQIYFFGAYSKNELSLLDMFAAILKPLRKNVCFVDIGANVGQHSLFMSKRVDKILSFEPQTEVVAQFKKNLSINDIGNITVFECALGDQDHVAWLGSGFEGNNGSRSITWTLDQEKTTEIQVYHAGRKLDQIGVGRIDIIKMDVEGYEKNVFAGLRQRFISDRPIIMFELVGKETKGGFKSLKEVKNHLYRDHAMFGVEGTSSGMLVDFDWNEHEEAVCIPLEILPHVTKTKAFKGLRPSNPLR